MITKKLGFTLIELLVVMLIIGILAAVAMPQYTRAVDKSRLASAQPLLSALFHAGERYLLATDSWPASNDVLDIEVPQDGNFTCTVYASGATCLVYRITNLYILYNQSKGYTQFGGHKFLCGNSNNAARANNACLSLSFQPLDGHPGYFFKDQM